MFLCIHEKRTPEKSLPTMRWIEESKSTHPLNEFFFQALAVNKKK
jgi:hypothetical protein